MAVLFEQFLSASSIACARKKEKEEKQILRNSILAKFERLEGGVEPGAGPGAQAARGACRGRRAGGGPSLAGPVANFWQISAKFRSFSAVSAPIFANEYKVGGMLSTDCKNQSLRDRVDYKFDCRLQSSEFREPDFFVVD